MKRFSILVASLLLLTVCLPASAQKLTSYTKYWDWLGLNKKIVYKTLPDGSWHSNAEYYNYAGDHLYTRTFKNGQCVYHKTYFKDGSINEEGAVDKLLDEYGIVNDWFYTYKSYKINKKGQRVLDFEYSLDRKTGYLTKCNVFDIETRKQLYKLTTSSDLKTTRYIKYNQDGSILMDIVYNMENCTFQIKTLDIASEYDGILGKIINGVMVLNTSIEKDSYTIEEVLKECRKHIDKDGNRILYDPRNKKMVISAKPSSPDVEMGYLDFIHKICDIERERFYDPDFNNMDLGFSYTKPGSFKKSYFEPTTYNDYPEHPYKKIADKIEPWWYECCKPIARFIRLEKLYSKDNLTYRGDFDGVNATGIGIATSKYPFWQKGITITGEFKNNIPIKGECIWHDDNGTPCAKYVGRFNNDGLMSDSVGIYTKLNPSGDILETYKGGFKDGLFEGEGTIQIKNGDTYTGSFVEGKYNGKGILRKADGAVYEGEFINGAYRKGKLVMPNGKTYEGGFYNGLFSGEGILSNSNGDSYKGSFVEGKYHGQGTLINKDCNYSGRFINGIMSGKGKLSYSDGRYFDGYFDRGKMDKTKPYKALVKADNGDYYDGDMIENKYQGNGCLTKPNGDYYKGKFINNVYQGKGEARITAKNGDIYCGPIQKFKYEGVGVLTKPNGDYYKGLFKSGKFLGNGEAKLTAKNGDVYYGKIEKFKYQGKGVYSKTNGDKYEGDFVANAITSGTLFYKNGDIFIGNFAKYLAVGEGKYIYKDNKATYIGLFAKGLKNGAGVLTFGDIIYKGTWKNNEMAGLFTISNEEEVYTVTIKAGIIANSVTLSFKNGDKFVGIVENGKYVKGVYTFKNGESFNGSWSNNKPAKGKVVDANNKVVKKGDLSTRNFCCPNEKLLKYPNL